MTGVFNTSSFGVLLFTMRSHNTYSTSLKAYYALGIEKQFVPKELQKLVPASTASGWKNMNTSSIIGIELDKKLPKDAKELDTLYSANGKIPRNIALIMTSFITLVRDAVGVKNLKRAFKTSREAFVNFTVNHKDILPMRSFAEVMQLSPKTIYSWVHQVKFSCDHSPIFLCPKRHSNQATILEVQIIKEWLLKPEYAHWGIHSIWAKAFKEGVTNLAKQSWYRYNQTLQIRKVAQKGKRPKYKPIIADQIHQIWHADITIFKTLDGVKYYIYTVMDNYSRFILSWRIEKVVSAKIRLETIQSAIHTNLEKTNPNSSIQLITDGGPENINTTLKEFMDENSATIHQAIALKDIVQSNSMMESFYRITKYTWLYRKKIKNFKQLHHEFEKWMQEYHFEKPHYALGIHTPHEVLNGADKKQNFSQRMKDAARKRRAFNKNVRCNKKC